MPESAASPLAPEPTHGISRRQTLPDHRRPVQPVDRLRHRPRLPPRGRRARLQLPGRALPGAGGRVRGRVRLDPGLRLRRRRRRPDRGHVRRPRRGLAELRRLRPLDRLRAQGSDRRRLPRGPVARGVPDRPRHLELQLPGHGQGGGAAADADRSPPHPDLSGRGAQRSQLQHHGAGQGVARGQRPLPGRPASARAASGSTASRPGRSRRWPPPASRASARSSTSSSATRRCAAT